MPLDYVLSRFCEMVIKEFGFRHCAVYLKHGNGQLQLDAHRDRADLPVNPSFELEEKITSHFMEVLDHGKPFTVRSPKIQNDRTPSAFRCANIPEGIILPVKVDFKVEGLLVLLWRGRRFPKNTRLLPHHDESRLLRVADLLGVVIKNARRRDQSKWQEFRLDRAHNRLVWENRAEACDRMASAIVNGLQEVESRFGALTVALREHIGTSVTVTGAHPIAESLADLRRSHEGLLEKAREARASLTISKGAPQTVSLNKLIDNLKGRLEYGLSTRNVTLNIDNKGQLTVKTVKKELSSLLEELLFSAIQATPRFGTVDVQTMASNKRTVEVIVSDRAPRLSAALCNRINHLQMMTHTSPWRARDLLLAHRLAHGIGAVLTVQSDGAGNKITLKVPMNVYA
jgi:hypothetical protein